ncbi:CatB-related O-acetyltransferase [Clostridium sp. E02]|uniref:CatB-related O-acetyltransferase n=1 Tax=Clostridium sp. E02 TaxID=2487134 RepID=UPI000F5378F9|nr:CatB-related O-acetyltransferase [Clostridium sp. E02]
MVYPVKYNPQTVKSLTKLTMPVEGERFPFMQIDRDSYIVGAEIQSGINFNLSLGVHCIQIGKYCALADNITFLVDLNHDYRSIFQGSPGFFNLSPVPKTRKKGTVILQNDVWIGRGVTIMSGVTIHNGAVVGAESVVTKSIPPYAIAAGNPAKIVGYRFTEEQRNKLNAIGWWNWSEELLRDRQADFLLPVEAFTEKYDKAAEEEWNQAEPIDLTDLPKNILLIADDKEPFSLWERIVTEFINKGEKESRLIVYAEEDLSASKHTPPSNQANVVFKTGSKEALRGLFAGCQYFITTRKEDNILWTEYANHYDTKLLYGTDIPIFAD